MPSVPLNFPVSAWLSCTHYSAPSQAGLLCKPRAWMEGLAAGWPWLWCSPRGFAPVFGAALTGNKSVGLSQCRLPGGGGRTLWVSATARSGREKSFRNTREKERYPQARLLCSPLASAGPCTVFSWVSFFPQFPRFPAQGCALSLYHGVLATAVHVAAWAGVWIPAWVGSLGHGEACQVHRGQDPPEAAIAQQVSVPVPKT